VAEGRRGGYRSAEELGRDVSRYLAGQPVAAGAAVGIQLHRFARGRRPPTRKAGPPPLAIPVRALCRPALDNLRAASPSSLPLD